MRTYEDEAIVVSGFKLGEADKILTLLVPEAGKVKAVAKGVRKTKSRFGGRLETLNHLEVSLFRGKSLYTVTGAHALEVFSKMRASLHRLEIGILCAEAAARAVIPGQPARNQFDHLLMALRSLDSAEPRPLFFAWFLLSLARMSGFEFHLATCVGCGSPQGLEYLSVPEGGAVCRSCKDKVSCYKAGGAVIDVMGRAATSPDTGVASEESARMATHASVKLFEYHLEDRLRSFRVANGLGLGI
jgi:DNA repair protein RecO (recombination protein O)